MKKFILLFFAVLVLAGCEMEQNSKAGTTESMFVKAGQTLKLEGEAWLDASGTDLKINLCHGLDREYADGGLRINATSDCFEIVSGSGTVTIHYIIGN